MPKEESGEMGTIAREAVVSSAHSLCLELGVDLNHSAFMSLERSLEKALNLSFPKCPKGGSRSG